MCLPTVTCGEWRAYVFIGTNAALLDLLTD